MDSDRRADLKKRMRELQEEFSKLQQELLVLEEENAQSSLHTLEEIQPQHCEETRALEEAVPSSLNNTQSQGKLESLIKASSLFVYEKTQGVEDHGKEFEKAMCVLYALKLIRDDSVYDFSMTTNNKKYELFDDIELNVVFKDGTRCIFLFQLKYREDRETINQHMLTQLRDKKQGKSKFYLPNYFEAVSKLDANGENVISILYTNRPVKIDGDKLTCKSYTLEVTKSNKIENKDLLLNTKSEKEIVFWFKPNCNSAGNETLELACQRFFILSDQDDLETVRTNTKESLKNLLCCDVYSSFEHFMSKWWSDNFVLTKHHVIAKLTELALSPYIRTISASKSNEKTKKLAKAMTTFEITIVEESQEDTICEIWEEISKEHDWKSSPLHKFEIANSGPTEQQKAKLLWDLNMVPLIVTMSKNNKKTIKNVLNLLQKDKEKKSLILLGSKETSDFGNWDVFETLRNLKKNSEIFKYVIRKFCVSLQGRKCISLEKLVHIDEDVTKIIRVEELLRMSQSEFLLIDDEEIQKLSLYIPRTVSAYLFNINHILALNEIGYNVIIINCSDKFKSNLQSRDLNVAELSDYLREQRDETRQCNILSSTVSRCTIIQFDQVCQKSKDSNVYLFQVSDDGRCFLLLIKGTLPRFKDSIEIAKNQILNFFDSSLNVLCAPPGMAKSLLLNALNNKSSPDFWAIQIELIGYNSFLAQKPNFEAIKSNFLKLDKTDGTFLAHGIKSIFYKNQKLLVFLDGLDEVDSRFVDDVIDFAKRISSEGVKVWISSRENLRQKIYQDLKVLPVEIGHLNQDQQRSYLRSRLENKYDEIKIDKIVKAVFQSADINSRQDSLGIPLQIHIISETFLNNEDAYRKIDQQNMFSLIDMYNLFFLGKVTTFENLGINKNNKSQLGICIEKVLERYELPSLKTCLNDSDYMLLQLTEKNDKNILKEIRRDGDKFGIIKSVDKMHRAIFTHQTFAEYFACLWFKKNKGKMKLLSQSIFSPRYDNLRRIFDIMLAENHPLHLAVIYKNIEEFSKSFHHADEPDEGGRTALHLACSYGMKYLSNTRIVSNHFVPRETQFYVGIMEKLLRNKDVVDKKDRMFEFSCATYAIQSRCLFPIEIMLEKKYINFKYLYPEICKLYEIDDLAYYAAKFGYHNLLRRLIEFHPGVVNRDIRGASLLQIAVFGHENDKYVIPRTGNIAAAKLLLERGASSHENVMLLEIICRKGCYDMIHLLIEKGFSCHGAGTIMHYMLQKEYLSEEESTVAVKIAKECKIDFNTLDYHGRNAFNLACERGHFDIIKLLLSSGVNPKIMDGFLRNSLHYACSSFKANREVVCLLISHGLDVNQPDAYGRTPLQFACEYSTTDIIKLLLDKGADRNVRDKRNNNLLHYACMSSEPKSEIINFFIDSGFDVNEQNILGQTAVELARINGDMENVRLLLKKGADPNIGDNGRNDFLPCLYEKRRKITHLWSP